MKVQIKVYKNELESVLDRIQTWGSQYEWCHTSPNFYIELDMLPLDEGTDRFALPVEASEDVPQVSNGLIDFLNAKKAESSKAKTQMDELRVLLKGE